MSIKRVPEFPLEKQRHKPLPCACGAGRLLISCGMPDFPDGTATVIGSARHTQNLSICRRKAFALLLLI